MDYKTYEPISDLKPLVKLYWTLEVPAEMSGQKQRILPDGCIDMVFILGDDIKRYTSDGSFVIQPRAMVLGQITEPFFVEPTGYVNSFAVCFYPYGFANFVSAPIKDLANQETPLAVLLGEATAGILERQIVQAADTKARIKIIESFLLEKLSSQTSIDDIVKTTIDTMFSNKGKTSVKNNASKRRQLERKFASQVGISPKQLGKVIRLQAALKIMLGSQPENLSRVAYESEYYVQAHFTRDFKKLTGTTPQEFFEDEEMALSSLLYK